MDRCVCVCARVLLRIHIICIKHVHDNLILRLFLIPAWSLVVH